MMLHRLSFDDRPTRTGQGIVEYGLILGLTSMLTIVILVFFGATVAQILAAVGTAIDKAG